MPETVGPAVVDEIRTNNLMTSRAQGSESRRRSHSIPKDGAGASHAAATPRWPAAATYTRRRRARSAVPLHLAGVVEHHTGSRRSSSGTPRVRRNDGTVPAGQLVELLAAADALGLDDLTVAVATLAPIAEVGALATGRAERSGPGEMRLSSRLRRICIASSGEYPAVRREVVFMVLTCVALSG
jgi:hypothetical protein